MTNFLLKNSARYMRSYVLTYGHVSVTWRDVTFCHGISGSPELPGTSRYFPVLPGTTGKVISEQSP
eukprot:747262-Amorphochlora_amoeboformis.AAC.1